MDLAIYRLSVKEIALAREAVFAVALFQLGMPLSKWRDERPLASGQHRIQCPRKRESGSGGQKVQHAA